MGTVGPRQHPGRPVADVVVIAAVADAPGTPADRLIGAGMDLPWHLPADLQRFKALTLGHPLIMGRRTFESLLHQFGGPLPGRENVVLTRHPAHVDHPGIHVYGSLDEAVEAFPTASACSSAVGPASTAPFWAPTGGRCGLTGWS